MKLRVTALLCFLLVAGTIAAGQTPATIEKTEISGISEDSLSASLRGDIQKLVGQSYDEKAATQIADRIHAELPDYVVTSTTAPGTQPNYFVLVFAVAHNINAKYIVESVELKGTEQSKLSEALWADMQKMVGHPVDDAAADQFRERMATELKNSHVRRSVERGNDPQHVRIIYESVGRNSINFSGSGGYHSRQKFSGRANVAYTFFDFAGVRVDGFNDASTLLERYAGYRYGAWTEYKRVRFNAEYSSFRAQWSPGTLQAASASGTSADLYRLRDTIEPSAKITITREFHITLGVTASQLQMQVPTSHFETVRTANGNADYKFYLSSSQKHQLSGSYDIRVAGDTLGGSASFTRHLFDQNYEFKLKKPDPGTKFTPDGHQLNANIQLGRITGTAPMFERFSLGSTSTLVGWNKYDISPLGASRMAYGAVTYTNRYFSTQFESGSLWNDGQSRVLHNAVGANLLLGNILHAPAAMRIILNAARPGIGIPLQKNGVHPIFTLGGNI
jgi:outer membrane protein assembly factor BamA